VNEVVTQPLLVRLPSEQARRISRIVNAPNSAYESLGEFIRVAVENQLTLEGADEAPPNATEPLGHPSGAPHSTAADPPVAVKPPSDRSHNRPAVSPTASRDYMKLLQRPTLDAISRHEAAPSSDAALSSFTNRLSPLLVGPRVLGNLSAGGAAPSVELFTDTAANAARWLGFRLRREDEAAGRRGRQRRSTAWPVGDDEGKSLVRFRNCFMFTNEPKGGFGGPLLDLGLVAVTGGEVFLTDGGAKFASAPVPAIDEPSGVELLSRDHREILAQALMVIPDELVEIQRFLSALMQSSGAPDEIDRLIAADHKWSDAQVVSHRAAMVGRLRDLQVVDVEVLPAGRAQIVRASQFEDFGALVSRTMEER